MSSSAGESHQPTHAKVQATEPDLHPVDEAQPTDAKAHPTDADPPPVPPEPPIPGDESQATAGDLTPSPLSPKPQTNSFLQENRNPMRIPPKKRKSSLPGDEAQATRAKCQAATHPFLQKTTLSSSDGKKLPFHGKPPLPPRKYVLVSKDQTSFTIPLRAALLSRKIKYDHRDKSEILCDIDAATLIKITTCMIKHSRCTEDGKSAKMKRREFKEWVHSVFLNQPIRILLSMLNAALWLQIPGMVKLIETKLAPLHQN